MVYTRYALRITRYAFYMIKILFIGDMVGKISRKAVQKIVPEIQKKYKPDLVIANVENVAHGSGITEKIFKELKEYGIQFMTLGDHAFDRQETKELLQREKGFIIRPANYPPHMPGYGEAIIEIGSKKILVINLLGRVFMKMDYDCPFRAIDEIIRKHKDEKFSAIIVDLHAEATSEKRAFGWYVDGRVSAVLGTHTHVPTCDQEILPKGTAYISDAGMVGAKNSVIGVRKEAVISTFLNQVKTLFEPVDEGICAFNSVLIEIDPETAKAKSIIRIDKEIEI